jgi:hypothetical protein
MHNACCVAATQGAKYSTNSALDLEPAACSIRLIHWHVEHSTVCVQFEVLTAVVPNVAIFWDIPPYSPCVDRRFGATYHLHQPNKKLACSRWQVRGFSETSIHIRTIRCYIPGDGNIEFKFYFIFQEVIESSSYRRQRFNSRQVQTCLLTTPILVSNQ